jgi:hypothetical protein
MKVYLVRHPDGRFFKHRSRAWSKTNGWVEQIDDAKIFIKLGTARSNVTWYANESGKIADIVEFDLVMSKVINEEERVQNARLNKYERELSRRKEQYQKELDRATKNYHKALEELKAKTKKVV